MVNKQSSRPLASLLTHVVSDVAYLLQTEIRLARAEMGEKLAQAANAGVFIGIGAVLVLSGFLVLLFSVVLWLEVAGLPERWGMLLVGASTVAIGVALALKGAGSVKGSALVPDRTIEQLRADYSVAKEHVS